MKKTTLLLLCICTMPVLGPWAGGRQIPGDVPNAGIAFLLPKIKPDFSDLDARDSQNRSIKSASASQELADLFRQNLVNLVVFSRSHSATQSLVWTDLISYLFNKPILNRLSVNFDLIFDVFLPPNRRVVHNVNNLCITFTVGIFVTAMLLAISPLPRTPRKVNLRC